LYHDEVPTVEERVVISKREYEFLKQTAREASTHKIKARNRILASLLMVLVFIVAGIYMYASK